MQYRNIGPGDLSEGELSEWRSFQQENPSLSSPYFCPEYTLAVAEVRDDVRITIVEDGADIVGFFPYQRSPLGFGRPVGGNLTDYHGLISRRDLAIDPFDLLRASHIVSWEFSHLPVEQASLSSHRATSSHSPVIRLGDGWERYCDWLQGTGTQVLKKQEYYRRRLEREFGTVSISHESGDAATLDALFRWKSEQYIRSGLVDVFGFPWTRGLLKALMARRGRDFRGVMSELRAGGRLIAAHFGISTQNTWHWWFPAYDISFAKYSPGIVLLIDAIRAACEKGIGVIDLGRGEAEYKARLSNDAIAICQGEVCVPSIRIRARNSFNRGKDRLRRSPLYTVLRRPLQWAGKAERRTRFH